MKTKLQQVYYKTVGRSTILYNHFGTIANAFVEHNIPVIALKGIYLSEWLYQDIGLRQFSDIDLLVKPEDGLRCLSLLTLLGYKPSDSGETEFVKAQTEIIHYPPMVLEGVSVEIHIKLHGKYEEYHLPVEQLWKNVQSVQLNNVAVYTLSMNDLLIHLCVHLDKHFQAGHVQFTCFNDITNLLEKQESSLNWDKFIETCRNYKCEVEVFRYILVANKYMNAPVPASIIQKYDSILTNDVEELFYKYLSGYTNTGFGSHVSTHVGNILKLESFADKFRYAGDILFPPKAFMIQKYRLVDSSKLIVDSGESVVPKTRDVASSMGSGKNYKRQTINYKLMFWRLWYPYRWWIGVKGLFRVISGQ